MLPGYLSGSILGLIIDDNHLQGPAQLSCKRFQQHTDIPGLVAGRNYYRGVSNRLLHTILRRAYRRDTPQ